jgi:hypothetical protein
MMQDSKAIEIAIGVYEKEEDIDPRVYGLVAHLSRALNMSISSIKGYLERDIGQVILKGNEALHHLRRLGAIGPSATSVAIFPLDRLVHALAGAKGPNKDLVKRIGDLHMEAISDSCDLSLGSKREEEDYDNESYGDEDEEEEEEEEEEREREEEDVVEVNGGHMVQSVLSGPIPKTLTLEEVGVLLTD